MKKSLIPIILAAVAAFTIVSCRNTNKAKEPSQEDVQIMKQALADSVLAYIDAFAEEYVSALSNSFTFRGLELTESEKLTKPDYLLDPSVANNPVTKTQKVNALAIYIVEIGVRMMYDMPVDETKEAVAKLAMEVNYPVDADNLQAKNGLSEVIKRHYDKCKERGELALFWQFHNAMIKETYYIIVQNPDLFFSKLTEEQWRQYIKRTNEKNYALRELAKYDEEMAEVLELFNKTRTVSSDEEKARNMASIESSKRILIAKKDKHIANRNILLQ